MKLDKRRVDLDRIDIQILASLQEHCKTPLAKIGQQVGLSAPAVIERIKKLEEGGVIVGYTALLDARKLGCDIAAFIGVLVSHPSSIADVEEHIGNRPEVLECHHVTGAYTLLLKVRAVDTSALKALISHLRAVDGVARTETMVVLSTHSEHQLMVQPEAGSTRRRPRRALPKLAPAESAG